LDLGVGEGRLSGNIMPIPRVLGDGGVSSLEPLGFEIGSWVL